MHGTRTPPPATAIEATPRRTCVLPCGSCFDVREKLRPEVKAEMPRGDEADLFNIAHNFTIRHLNEKQKGNHDSALWHSWMFHVNLSTIHVITRLMARKARHQAVGTARRSSHGQRATK